MGVSTPRSLSFAIYGPIRREDLPGLGDRVCALLDGSDAGIAYCDVRDVEPDAVAVLARLVLAERRRAVRRADRDHPRAAAGDPGAVPPREDVVAAAQPQVVRRHRLRRVLADELRECVHVVGLERLDVAREQALVSPVYRRLGVR